jgi:excisionase family DNA binding protein
MVIAMGMVRVLRARKDLDMHDAGSPDKLGTVHLAQSPWLKVRDAAARARCGVKVIYREVNAGRLRAARIGGRRELRVREDWLDQWLTSSATVSEVLLTMTTRGMSPRERLEPCRDVEIAEQENAVIVRLAAGQSVRMRGISTSSGRAFITGSASTVSWDGTLTAEPRQMPKPIGSERRFEKAGFGLSWLPHRRRPDQRHLVHSPKFGKTRRVSCWSDRAITITVWKRSRRLCFRIPNHLAHSETGLSSQSRPRTSKRDSVAPMERRELRTTGALD